MEKSSSARQNEPDEGGRDEQNAPSPFNRILVPVDGSDASIEACRVAVRVASTHRLAITALYVVENKAVEEFAAASGDSRESVRRQMEEKGWRYLNHMEILADQYGVACNRLVRRGIPHSQIADVARDTGVDLIVIGDSRLQSARRAISGSLTERVIEYAPCSVLVVRRP